MKYAKVEDGKVVNVLVADSAFAQKDGLVEAPRGVGIGHLYDGTVFTPPPTNITLEDAKQRAIRRINGGYSQAMNAMVPTYPEMERESWGKQEKEARAWLADNTVSTPLLAEIANARGMTLAELAPRVIAKADVWMQLSGAATGKRQKLESDIAAIQITDYADEEDAIAAVEAIRW